MNEFPDYYTRLDKMEELFMRSVMLGDHDPLDEAEDFYKKGDDVFGEIEKIYPERAKDGPFGTTIAHGYLTLSLIPMLNHQISHINNVRNGINYGCNKVRFTSPVPAGAKVRARAKLIAADPMSTNKAVFGMR